jgi:hypothetical protein
MMKWNEVGSKKVVEEQFSCCSHDFHRRPSFFASGDDLQHGLFSCMMQKQSKMENPRTAKRKK